MSSGRGGYTLLETVLCLALLAALVIPAVSVVRAGQNFYLDIETAELLQRLRCLEKKSLNNNSNELSLKRVSSEKLVNDFFGMSYYIQRGLTATERHRFRSNLKYYGNLDTVYFTKEGRPYAAGTLMLRLTDGYGKNIIIDRVGRLRIEVVR